MTSAAQKRLTSEEKKKLKSLGGIEWIKRKLAQARLPAPKSDACFLYTHAYLDGRVFYVGSGHGTRHINFSSRNPAHKAAVKAVGRKNVIITLYPVSNPMLQFYEESLLIKRCLLEGAPLLQTIPVDVLKEVREIQAQAL